MKILYFYINLFSVYALFCIITLFSYSGFNKSIVTLADSQSLVILSNKIEISQQIDLQNASDISLVNDYFNEQTIGSDSEDKVKSVKVNDFHNYEFSFVNWCLGISKSKLKIESSKSLLKQKYLFVLRV